VKVCLVSTAGGHLTQLAALAVAARGHDCYLVTVRSPHVGYVLPGMRRYFVRQILRNPANFVANFVQSVRILLKERPDAVITTGAGDALPTVLLAAAVGSTTIFVESLARVDQPSLFGRLIQRWCDAVMVQWSELRTAYPRAVVIAPVLGMPAVRSKPPPDPSILVLTGTHTRGFERLLKSLDERFAGGKISFQIGHSRYLPRHGEFFRFAPHEELVARMKAADIVITHDGSASIWESLLCGKSTIVVPRRSSAREVTYQSGQYLARHLAKLGLVVLVENPDRVGTAIEELRTRFPQGISFNHPDPVETLRKYLFERKLPIFQTIDSRRGPKGVSTIIVTPANPWEAWPSGIRTYTEALIANLSQVGAGVTVLTTGRSSGSPYPNVSTITLSERRPSSLRFLAQLLLAGPKLPPAGDILHFQRPDHVLPLLPWIRSRSRVVTLHGDAVRSVSVRRGRVWAAILRIAEALGTLFMDRVVAVDEGTKRVYERRFPWLRGRVEVIPIGFWSPPDATPQANVRRAALDLVPSDAKLILFAGRLVAEKNLGLLVDSFAELLSHEPSAFLMLVGEGPEEGVLRDRLRSHSITRYTFVPTLKHRELLELIQRAEVVSITSSFEAASVLAIEAICLGTPIITTPVGRLPEILGRWDVGIVARPERQSFAEGLARILERGKAFYAPNCQEAARALSFDSTFHRTLGIYASVRESGSRRPES